MWMNYLAIYIWVWITLSICWNWFQIYSYFIQEKTHMLIFNTILTRDKKLRTISPLFRPEEKSAIELNRVPSFNLEKEKKDKWASYWIIAELRPHKDNIFDGSHACICMHCSRKYKLLVLQLLFPTTKRPSNWFLISFLSLKFGSL